MKIYIRKKSYEKCHRNLEYSFWMLPFLRNQACMTVEGGDSNTYTNMQ